MRQLDLLRDTIRPLLGTLPDGEQNKIIATFDRVENRISHLTADYELAIQDRAAVHALLKKTSDDLIQRYQTLFEFSGTAMIVIEEDGTISLANTFFTQLFGFTRKEIENRKQFIDFIDERSRPTMLDYHRRRREGDPTVPHYYEAKAVTREGGVLDVALSVVLFPGTKQSIASFMDITGWRQAEEAVRQANKKLNLLSGITRHDIRNQLLALSTYIYLSEESLDDKVQLLNYIAKEKAIAEAISRQISFTKDYEEMGVKAPAWQNVSAIVTRMATQIPVGTVRVENGDPTLEVYADPLLEKVFYNLIDNALRYGGDRMTRIRVTGHEEPEGMVIVVEDDGAGIVVTDKSQLFNKGFGRHTGLGLYLSREILSITDITITENGEPGKGAHFAITVPTGAYRWGCR